MYDPSVRTRCLSKTLKPILWSGLLQSILLFLYLFLTTFSLWTPLELKLFSAKSSSLTLIPFVIALIIQAVICLRPYVSLPGLVKTRAEWVSHLFTIRNFVMIFLHLSTAVSLYFPYILLRGESLFESSSESGECLNEKSFVSLFVFLWAALFQAVNEILCGTKTLLFPFVRQKKLARIKVSLIPTVRSSAKYAVYVGVSFLFLYFLFGGRLRSFFLTLLGTSLEKQGLDSFFGVVGLFPRVWSLSFVFALSARLTELLLRTHLEEVFKFPLVAGPADREMNLSCALSLVHVPILHYSAFRELFSICERSKYGRTQIFSLSQPGGHPHTWNRIKEECFRLVNTFGDAIDLALKGPARNLEILRTKPREVQHPSLIFPPSQESHFLGPKPKEEPSKLERYVKEKVDQLQSLPIVVFFTGDVTEMKTNYLLLQCQPVIWACESLSHLFSHSLNEDKFGVLQNDREQIIMCLLKLKYSLDRLIKYSGCVKKPRSEDLSTQLRNTLRSTVKRCLYRIAVTFQFYISDLHLPKEIEKQMKAFVEFKEA